jgi:branched-chain amino acid transport system substrate-binding protein
MLNFKALQGSRAGPRTSAAPVTDWSSIVDTLESAVESTAQPVPHRRHRGARHKPLLNAGNSKAAADNRAPISWEGALVKRILLPLLLLAAATGIRPAAAQTPPLRIGVLTDMGGMSSSTTGPGSVAAAKLALEDFGGAVLGRPIELVAGDHQNKPDVGAAVARQWYEQDGVRAIFDIPNSSVGFAVQEVAKRADRLVIFSTGGSSDLSGKACNANTVVWSYNTYAVAKTAVATLIKEGGPSWFFLSGDYAGAISMEADAARLLKQAGGTVAGAVHAPLGTTDFSSFLLQAQASQAKVLMVSTSGDDQTNALKQAHEFNLPAQGFHLASTFSDPVLLKAAGPQVADGYLFSSSWYYDQDDRARAFAARFFERMNVQPSMFQAGVYSAVSNYLGAIKAANSDDAQTVMAKLRETPVNDMFVHDGRVREDGQMVHTMYLLRGKGAAEMKGPWDLASVVASVAPEQAFLPLSESVCPLVRPKQN